MIKFTKLSATGNDFILIENLDNKLSGEEYELFRTICQRRRSIGADGVLLLNNSDQYDYSMRYYNSDGSLGEMCGNGARASAYYALARGIAQSSHVTFDVLGVEYSADIDGTNVRLEMPSPVEITPNTYLFGEPEFYGDGYVNAGVPHYVLLVDDVQAIDVNQIGRKYRHHPQLQPWGANVDFVQIISESELKMRTYERGVEEETLACGTGTISSVAIAMKLKGITPPVKVHAPGGLLVVDCDTEMKSISLTGEVNMIYDGELHSHQL